MGTSDWVLVTTSLFLGATALFVPMLSELLKRRVFAPKLTVLYEPNPPFCVKTFWRSQQDPALNEPVFFWRFQVYNSGQSQARACEAVLEELWTYDASGTPAQLTYFSAQNLGIGATNINPERRVFAAIGHLSSATHQNSIEKNVFSDMPGKHGNELRFLFDEVAYPNNQPNCLVPGKYAVKISLYAENAPHEEVYFAIDWSGKWQDTETEMFHELVIRRTQRPSV